MLARFLRNIFGGRGSAASELSFPLEPTDGNVFLAFQKNENCFHCGRCMWRGDTKPAGSERRLRCVNCGQGVVIGAQRAHATAPEPIIRRLYENEMQRQEDRFERMCTIHDSSFMPPRP